MLEKTVSKIESVKTTVVRHRAKIAVVATAATAVYVMHRNAKVLNEFLEEHNLTDAYYTPENSY